MALRDREQRRKGVRLAGDCGALVRGGDWIRPPTAALIWILWRLWRAWNPGGIRRPEGFLAGIAEFLLVCVFVILVVLAWELFKTWRQPQHSAESHAVRIAAG